jgi:DNA-binding transcriptional LysR family regulator
MLKPIHLRTLTVVVRTGSFTDAGRELGYTASAVAQQIASLERDLGVRLVEREPQRIRPTPAAILLAERSVHALDLLAALAEEARAFARGTLGRLRIGTALDPGSALLAESVAGLGDARSRLDILLEHDEPERVLARVQEGALDVGMLHDFPAAPRTFPAELAVLPLAEHPWQLVVPQGWRRATDLRVLADVECIVGLGAPGQRALAAVCSAAGFSPHVRLTTESGDVVLALVAAGVGMGVVPTLSWPPPGPVSLIPLTHEGATRRTIAVYRHGSGNPAVQVAIRALEATSQVGR